MKKSNHGFLKNNISFLFVSTLGMVSLPSYALGSDAVFQDTVNDYRGANTQIEKAVEKNNLTELIPNYTTDIKEKNNYGDETQTSDALNTKGIDALNESEAAKTVFDNFSMHPVIRVDPNDDDLKKNASVEADAGSVLDGQTDIKTCHLTLTKMSCTESVRALHQACDKTPKISITSVETHHDESLSGNIKAKTKTSGTFILPFDGVITAFSVTLKSSNVWLCKQTYQGKLNEEKISQQNVNCGHYLGDLNFKNKALSISVKKNQPLTFQLIGTAYGQWQWAKYQLTIQVVNTKKTAHVSWQEDCHYV